MKGHLEEKPENNTSPSMWLSVNPGYRLEANAAVSHFKETFKGEREEPCDKVYFRKKDELSNYAEVLFQSKVVLSKK
jgi:hypothetical protein